MKARFAGDAGFLEHLIDSKSSLLMKHDHFSAEVPDRPKNLSAGLPRCS